MKDEINRRQFGASAVTAIGTLLAGCNTNQDQEETEPSQTLDVETPNQTERSQNLTDTPREYETVTSTSSGEKQLDPFCQHALEEDDTLNFHYSNYSTGESEEYSVTNLDVHPEQGAALRFDGDLGGLEDETHIWVNEGYSFQLREGDEAYTVSEIDYDEEKIIIEDC